MAKSKGLVMSRIQRAIIDYPILVLLATLLITLYFGRLIPELHFSSSSDEFFIEDDPDKAFYEKAKSVFGNDQVVMAALVAPEGRTVYTVPEMEKLERLTKNLSRVDGVKTVVSLANISNIRAPRDPVTGEYQKAIEVRKVLETIPRTEEQWKQLRSEINHNPLYLKNFVSEDGRAAAIAVFIRDFDRESQRYEQVMGEIDRIVKAEDNGKGIYLAGVPVTRVEIVKRMTEDMTRLLPLSFLLIVVVLFASFRSLRGVILPLLIIIVTTIWAVGFMESADIPITMVTMILPPLMLALGSSYSMHLMNEYLAEANPGLSSRMLISGVLEKVTTPIFVCGVTTIIGFASFIPNGIPAIKQLGYASVAGISFAIIIALLAMSSLLVMMKPPRPKSPAQGKRELMPRFLDGLARAILKHRKAVFAAAAIISVISIFGVSRIRIDTDFLSFFAKDDPVIKAVDVQTRYLAGAAPFNIVLEADRPDAFKDPALLKRMEELQRFAETKVKGIDTTMSMADYVKLLNQAFHQNDPAYYRIPDSRKELSQLLLFYANAGSPEDFAPYMNSNYSAANVLIRSRLVGSSETMQAIREIEQAARTLFEPPRLPPLPPRRDLAQTPAVVSHPPPEADEEEISWGDDNPVPTPSPGALSQEAAPPAEPTPPAEPGDDFNWPHVQVRVTGTIFLMNKSADAVSRGQVQSLGLAIIAVFLIMAMLFLSFKIGLLSMLPSIFSVAVLFGIMGLFGITLNFATSLIAGIAIGIGIDDTIHYISRCNSEVQRTRDQNQAMIAAIQSMGKPMIFTSVALFFGFIILAVSDFIPIRQFGILAGVSMLVANASNIVLLPALLVSVRIVTLWDLLDLAIGDNPARYIKIFSGLTNHQAKLAVLMGYLEERKHGDRIISEGQVGNEMYVVIKGFVNIVKKEGGREAIAFTVQPGESFGEMGLLRHAAGFASASSPDATVPARAEAEGNVKLFVLDEQTLARLQKRYPRISSQIYYNISKILSDRLQLTAEQYFSCALNVPPEEKPG
jgi:hypothetical protein